jgi:hypothetical protein
MGHVVHYRTAAGEPRLEEAPSLDAALALVERLRNDHEAEDVRLFREIPLQVRTYYKVAVVDEDTPTPAEDPTPAPVAAAVEPPPGAMTLSPPPTVVSTPDPAEPAQVESPRRPSLFTRSG